MSKLKGVKPSELPCFAVIEIPGHEGDYDKEWLFMRDSLGGWSLVMPHDIHEADKYEVRPADADEYFKDFVVQAVPYGWKRPQKPALIWKDIPGFPYWQVSNNGRVRNTQWRGYQRRTEAGHFNLYVDGKPIRWSEAELGTEEQKIAFFAN
jgi:hypothetical protein